MKVWVLLSIGCIECGDDNAEALEGVYSTEGRALEALEELKQEAAESQAENERRGYTRSVRPWENGDMGFRTSDWQVRLFAAEVKT